MARDLVRRSGTVAHRYFGMIAASEEMLAVFDRIRRAGRSDVTVLVRGDTGTGKEMVARALHMEGKRADRPFRAVNCATFTPELLASELFGHVKGAFTGAVRDKAGLLAQAEGGTLFLDEISELSLELQARLLRVLQERRYTPVGGTNEVEVDVRIISATNASLRERVASRAFREDLMYRLRVVVLYLPPLRTRINGLDVLTWHTIDMLNARGGRQIHAISGPAWRAMKAYGWPGNVRELQNNLEQSCGLGDGHVLGLEELAPELLSGTPLETEDNTASLAAVAQPQTSTDQSLSDMERDRLVAAWYSCGGRRSDMAEHLSMSRSTLYRKLKRHGLA
ncbi:MAG: two-component system response regulator AtoC [Kiritimatiellia bacterium]|jgi:two-component system response regulator AtoC